MVLSKYEQEVVINFNAEESKATIYTANPLWIRKMDKLVEGNPDNFKLIRQDRQQDKIIAKVYEFPKELISIRSKKITRNLTEEQKEKFAERMKQSRGVI